MANIRRKKWMMSGSGLIVPNDVPFYRAGIDELVWAEKFAGAQYADLATTGTYPGSGIVLTPNPGPLLNPNPINPDSNGILTPGWDGTGRAPSMMWPGTYANGEWQTFPTVAVPDPLLATGVQLYLRMDSSDPDFLGAAIKLIELWHPNFDRAQFDTHSSGPWYTGASPVAGNILFQMHDQQFGIHGALQARGPFLYPLINTGYHQVLVITQCNTPNEGSIDILVYSCPCVFTNDQSSTIVNGDVIALKNFEGASMSTSGFRVSAFNGSDTCTLTRTTDAITKTYAGGQFVQTRTGSTYKGVFSTSQAGEPTVAVGRPLAFNDSPQSIGPYRITAFDGTTGCDLVKISRDDDALDIFTDTFGVVYSSKLDGIGRMWVNGEKVVDISAAAAGTSPLDGFKDWCALEEIGIIVTGQGVNKIALGGQSTVITPPFSMAVSDCTWFRRARMT